MRFRTVPSRRVAAGVLAGGLLLAPLTGCSGSSGSDADASPGNNATETTPAEDTGATETSESPGGGAGATNAEVDCSGTSCSVTLTGGGAEADILGTAVVLETVADGRATIRVGDREVSCSEGETVSAGPLSLACDTVDQDAVTMTASLG